MRGKQNLCQNPLIKQRNIPAYAGKTRSNPAKSRSCREHPRVCGENASPFCLRTLASGTSPRMRGKLQLRFSILNLSRNIPAYAGKTEKYSVEGPVRQEHPRVCGENDLKDRARKAREGTSPRMRGKPSACLDWEAKHRNIPAYAGKTPVRSTTVPVAWEHPRVCGENKAGMLRRRNIYGTSPRMRGKRPRVVHRHTPNLEHPRVCGENRKTARLLYDI